MHAELQLDGDLTRLAAHFTVQNGASVSLDVTNTTQLASSFAVNHGDANGDAPSSLTGVTISTDGTLDFQYRDGVSSPGYDVPWPPSPATISPRSTATRFRPTRTRAQCASAPPAPAASARSRPRR